MLKHTEWSIGRSNRDLKSQRPLKKWLGIAGLAILTSFIFWRSLQSFEISRWREENRTSALKPGTYPSLPLKDIPHHLTKFQRCSIRTLQQDTGLYFLASAKPLEMSEFMDRRQRLAEALHKDGFDAFAVEPGYTFSYYANVTQSQWEVWEPEERPFIMVVKPHLTDSGSVVANTTFLVPAFEAQRARLLQMPFLDEIDVVTYEEHWNPYSTLLHSPTFASHRHQKKTPPKMMVDEEMRDFISRGLAQHGFEVHGLGGSVERVRQTKSPAEIGILRAVNTGTVEAVRAMRKCLTPGLREDDVMSVLDNTMRSAGLDPFFDIVLFDENASNPHGGTNGTKVLEKETMVLIDVGAHLYGYSSDICRSFFPPFFPQVETTEHDIAALDDHHVQEKLHVWRVVFDAQTASLHALHENASCAAVDLAARQVIDNAGYGQAFTHRVGHGIGIKAHESPYLHKGNTATLLKAGMCFTSEPGIYLVDKFGIRHEDVLLVREDGLPELLTGKRAGGPWDP